MKLYDAGFYQAKSEVVKILLKYIATGMSEDRTHSVADVHTYYARYFRRILAEVSHLKPYSLDEPLPTVVRGHDDD